MAYVFVTVNASGTIGSSAFPAIELSTSTGSATWDGTIEYYAANSWGTSGSWTTWDGSKITSNFGIYQVSTTYGKHFGILLRGTGNTVLNSSSTSNWIINTKRVGSFSGDIYGVRLYGNIEPLFDYATVDNSQHPTIDQYACDNLLSGNSELLNTFEFPDISSVPDYAFRNMYKNCTGMTSISSLPATTVGAHAYEGMFQGCTSLISTSALPATTLGSACYVSMFQGCSSLTTAPELPATTLANNCYYSMFKNCTSLTTAPALPATTLVMSCYTYMFQGCTSLTTAPALPATTLALSCYSYMFQGCSSLTTAPKLPATTLTTQCYFGMFDSCTSLVAAPQLPATTLANYCYFAMFRDCTSLVNMPLLCATTLASNCYSYMFNNCTSLKNIYELPATTLADECYLGMFKGCTLITTPINLPATTSAYESYLEMFYNTGIELSTTQSGSYLYPYIITIEGTPEEHWNDNMFYGSGVNSPSANVTYYSKHKVVDHVEYWTTQSELTSVANSIRDKMDAPTVLTFPYDYIQPLSKMGSQVYYTGSSFPPDNLGENGDIYIQIGV